MRAVLALGVVASGMCALEPRAFAQDQALASGPALPDQPAELNSGTPSDPNADSGEIAQLPVTEAPGLPPEPVPKRLLGIIPNYRAHPTIENYKPLTTSEKFRIARNDSFDWPNYFLLAGYAIQAQVAHGGFQDNGGLPGFGEYYARAVADGIIGNYVTEAILPTLLHEDPRFFRLGKGSFWHRTSYVASRLFVTRMDNGSTRFNVAEVVGNAGVVALTTLYYPDSQSVEEGAERYGMQLGNDLIANLLTEFWPDIKHHLPFRKH